MSSTSRIQRQEIRSCKKHPILACGITEAQLVGLVGNPAGTQKPDVINPNYKGKVIFKNGILNINLNYILTGDIVRAEVGLKNIKDIFAGGNVSINFTAHPSKFDLRIHGASLTEIVQGLALCTCEAGLYIGGWGPSHNHSAWGNALLLGSTAERSTWKMTDAHEFGHKLGLKHRTDKGMMDYATPNKKDVRTFSANDRLRIINLYR